jgi:hypothetical protein
VTHSKGSYLFAPCPIVAIVRRRRFYEIYVGGHSPIATEVLVRIKQLHAIEEDDGGPEGTARVVGEYSGVL